jgi:hypothetical protein
LRAAGVEDIGIVKSEYHSKIRIKSNQINPRSNCDTLIEQTVNIHFGLHYQKKEEVCRGSLHA